MICYTAIFKRTGSEIEEELGPFNSMEHLHLAMHQYDDVARYSVRIEYLNQK